MQVEQLRSELTAYSHNGRADRPRLRRYRTGLYTRLPNSLRRHVQEVRQRESKAPAQPAVVAAASRPKPAAPASAKRRRVAASLTPRSA